MKPPLTYVVSLLATCISLTAAAQQEATDAKKAVASKKLESMSTEQKAAREKTREKWQSKTPEQKAAAEEKARAKWESMTPEQRAEAKKQFEQRNPAAAAKASPQKGQ